MPTAQGQTLMKKAVALTWTQDSAHSEGGFEAKGVGDTNGMPGRLPIPLRRIKTALLPVSWATVTLSRKGEL